MTSVGMTQAVTDLQNIEALDAELQLNLCHFSVLLSFALAACARDVENFFSNQALTVYQRTCRVVPDGDRESPTSALLKAARARIPRCKFVPFLHVWKTYYCRSRMSRVSHSVETETLRPHVYHGAGRALRVRLVEYKYLSQLQNQGSGGCESLDGR